METSISGARYVAFIAVFCVVIPVVATAGHLQIVLDDVVSDPGIDPSVRSSFSDDDGLPLRSVSIDLNGDGVPEKFIPNEFLCGQGGCPWLIYEQQTGRVIGKLFSSAIEVMDETVNDYKVLQASYSTGRVNMKTRVYEYSNGVYREVTRRPALAR